MSNFAKPGDNHRKLLDALKDHPSYACEEKPFIGAGEWVNTNVNQLNAAVALMVDYLNMSGGSVGEMDLYVLMRAYLKNEKCREEINTVIRNHGIH